MRHVYNFCLPSLLKSKDMMFSLLILRNYVRLFLASKLSTDESFADLFDDSAVDWSEVEFLVSL